MSTFDSLQAKPAMRRICADFHGNDATELDLLEVRLGIHRAARSKGERDAALMELAIFSLKKHLDAYSGMIGDQYPDYQSLAGWLESTFLADFTKFLLHGTTSAPAVMIAATSESPVHESECAESGV